MESRKILCIYVCVKNEYVKEDSIGIYNGHVFTDRFADGRCCRWPQSLIDIIHDANREGTDLYCPSLLFFPDTQNFTLHLWSALRPFHDSSAAQVCLPFFQST